MCYDDYCGVCDDIPENDCVQDCAGTWGGDAVVDECGTCDSDASNDCVQDCAGTWGGDLELDCGDVCGGDNSTALSCCGLPFYDDCTTDCYEDSIGTCCIEEDADECGLCFGDGTSCCEDGETNNDNPCNPWECWGDEWYEIIIDCAEQEGVPCEGGVYVPPADGECCSECVLFGDINGDGTINVIDIVMAVDLILNNSYDVVGDVNEDGQLNVIDIVVLVDWVLNGMPDADSDGDGVIDDEDSDPFNPYQCSDHDGDTCDDCSTGHYDTSDDGYDYDGDGQCDDGDCDDDNDGCQECWDYCP